MTPTLTTLTDTAQARYPYYHATKDLPDRVNYKVLAKAVIGLAETIAWLANED